MATANILGNGIQSEPTSGHIRQISVCNDNHQYDFFCTNCKSILCAKCWVLKHRRDLKHHEAIEIDEKITRNSIEITESIRKLNVLSGKVDTVIKEKTIEIKTMENKFCQEMNRRIRPLKQLTRTGDAIFQFNALEFQGTENDFAAFCGEVQRKLMIGSEEHIFHTLIAVRCEMALLIRETNLELPKEAINLISSQFAVLDKLHNVSERVRCAVVDAIQIIEHLDAVEKAFEYIEHTTLQKKLISMR